MSDESSKFSLRKEIQKRKTQEFEKIIEARRTGQTGPLGQAPSSTPRTIQSTPAARTTQMAAAARITQTASKVAPVARQKPAGPMRFPPGVRLPWSLNRSQKLILAITGLLLLLVGLVTWFVMNRQQPTEAASSALTWTPLPVSSVDNAVAYLKRVGFPLSIVKPMAVPDGHWYAQQAAQITSYRNGQTGRFLLLSYASVGKATVDAFRASEMASVHQWSRSQVANILVFTSPDSDRSLSSDLLSHLQQYLVVPYRSFLPSATPGPTAASTVTPAQSR